MNRERERKYARLAKQTRDTPYIELDLDPALPRGCRMFAKLEYRNPSGSHYDREMWRFIKSLEEDNVIQPGATRMLETTTGNSGASFAWMCRALGYPPPTIIIPQDMPYARREQIASYGASLILSTPGDYITGISREFGRLSVEYADEDSDIYCPRHWEDTVHGVQGMKELGSEILRDSAAANVPIDYFMLALGNGSSARGIGDVLRSHDIDLIGVEPAESPIVAEFLGLDGYGGPKYEPPAEAQRHHRMIGTGPARASQIYNNMRFVAASGWLSTIEHPSTTECEAMQVRLADTCGQWVGMTSAAVVVAVQHHLARSPDISNCVFGAVFYDAAWKYL